MTTSRIHNEYFDWLCDVVCGKRYSEHVSFRKLLSYLHDTEFIFSIPKDANRAEDGVNLRYRFAISQYHEESVDSILYDLDGPCSVLEMMVALALRCEETIMDDASIGNRTGQWFWGMIANLGLGSMTNDKFDIRLVEDSVRRFLCREYEPDGRGGLFYIRRCDRDLRFVEIWHQLCWYLDSIYG